MKILSPFLLVMTLAIFVSSCDGNDPTPSASPAPPPSTKPKSSISDMKVPTILEAQKDPYFYNPAGKRDPFEPVEGDTSFKEANQSRSPLERFALSDMLLTGIVWGIADPRALIRTPDSQSYIVRANTSIGKNKGRVSRVTKKEVFVEEEYRDPTGKLVVREFKFEIRKPKVEEENSENLKLIAKEPVQ